MERKYTRVGENPKRYECTKRKCKWQGYTKDKSQRDEGDGMKTFVCPKCGNDEFYGLLK